MSSPHTLIVGEGIGGLALAQGLKKNGISFTLFERDLSPTARAQGYRVRLSDAIGATALRECLDQQMWDLFEGTCGEMKPHNFRFNAIDGTELEGLGPSGPIPRGVAGAKMEAAGAKFPPGMFGSKAYTVDRNLLRSLLLLGQEGQVKFGKSFERYELTSTGVIASFSDGTKEQGSFLLGAEGVTSPLRKQLLPNQRYVDTGSRVIYGKTTITPKLTARFLPKVLEGGVTVIQNLKGLTLFLEPIRFPKDASVESGGRLGSTKDYVYWVLGGCGEHLAIPDDEFHALSHKGAADLALKLTEDWKPAFRALLELQGTDQTSPLRIVSAKPERPAWIPSAHDFLLGDAVHAMMPIGGAGANAALEDAASLLKVIVEEGISEKTMGKYVDQMWERAAPYIRMSAMGAQKLLGFKSFEGAKEIDF
jgi:2-polyprenyl-6-methoxyphenol hydroxylase-like FAD-dependent oxidoreductase